MREHHLIVLYKLRYEYVEYGIYRPFVIDQDTISIGFPHLFE